VDKRGLTTAGAKYLLNPITKAGVHQPGVIVLETTGRRSGKSRRVPVGGRLEGGSVWVVAEHGRRAGYVRNIEVNPRVRVKLAGRWRDGTAALLPDDDPRKRLRTISRGRLGLKLNSAVVRLMQTDLLTVRIDLDAERHEAAEPGSAPA